MSYTPEEKEMMASIMRDDFLNERKLKARRLQNRQLSHDTDEGADSTNTTENDASASADNEVKVTHDLLAWFKVISIPST